MAGVKGRSGNWSTHKAFEARCMLEQSAGILMHFQSVTEDQAKTENLFSEFNVERRRIALEIFKKLAPSSIDVKSDSKTEIVIRFDKEESQSRINNYATVN